MNLPTEVGHIYIPYLFQIAYFLDIQNFMSVGHYDQGNKPLNIIPAELNNKYDKMDICWYYFIWDIMLYVIVIVSSSETGLVQFSIRF